MSKAKKTAKQAETITITLVKGQDGRYTGLTVSDRWNIETIKQWQGIDPNNAGFAEYRAYLKGLGFKIAPTKSGTVPQVRKTVAEFAALLCKPLAHRVLALKSRAA